MKVKGLSEERLGRYREIAIVTKVLNDVTRDQLVPLFLLNFIGLGAYSVAVIISFHDSLSPLILGLAVWIGFCSLFVAQQVMIKDSAQIFYLSSRIIREHGKKVRRNYALKKRIRASRPFGVEIGLTGQVFGPGTLLVTRQQTAERAVDILLLRDM